MKASATRKYFESKKGSKNSHAKKERLKKTAKRQILFDNKLLLQLLNLNRARAHTCPTFPISLF
jgi:hypothetical protein